MKQRRVLPSQRASHCAGAQGWQAQARNNRFSGKCRQLKLCSDL
ncbi:MAG: hypothetical protein ACI83N_000810, partial [Hydrogenophaga sp.]